MILTLIGLNSAVIAQQKYALLVGGNYLPGNEIPVEHRWNNGQNMDPVKGYDEFWNDCYLMWELLYDADFYGYSNENINVLFGGGEDYTFDEQDDRYKSWPNFPEIPYITDGAATKTNVMDALDDYSALTENDYLFIWIMSNGGNTDPEDNMHSYVYLWGYDPQHPNDGRLYDYELADALDDINAQKIVVIIQAPNAGGFIDQLEGDNRVIITSSDFNEAARRADNRTVTNQSRTENEVDENEITYNHGEFGFHLYSAFHGADPTENEEYYDGLKFSVANKNEDRVVSFKEMNDDWLSQYQSAAEEPLYSSIDSDDGRLSTPQFAYLVIDDLSEQDDVNLNGIIAVTSDKDQGYEKVTLSYCDVNITNAVVHFLGEARLFIEQSYSLSGLSIGENVIMKGNNGSSALFIISPYGLNVNSNTVFTGLNEHPLGRSFYCGNERN